MKYLAEKRRRRARLIEQQEVFSAMQHLSHFSKKFIIRLAQKRAVNWRVCVRAGGGLGVVLERVRANADADAKMPITGMASEST